MLRRGTSGRAPPLCAMHVAARTQWRSARNAASGSETPPAVEPGKNLWEVTKQMGLDVQSAESDLFIHMCSFLTCKSAHYFI